MHITFDFATKDDCLDKMVPSDLRQLVSERDHAIKERDALAAQVGTLRSALDSVVNYKFGETYAHMLPAKKALESTPAACLAQVRAEAVRDFIYWGQREVDPEFCEFIDCSEEFIRLGLPSLPREGDESIQQEND